MIAVIPAASTARLPKKTRRCILGEFLNSSKETTALFTETS